jgi:hypothetical protein
LERDKLIALLIGKGVPEADAGVLADELIASMAGVKVEIEGADMKHPGADMKVADMKPDPAMDAVRKAADARVAAVQKAADAAIKVAKDEAAAANKRANDAEIARAGERVRRAADSLQLGKDATDVQKLAEQVADKCAVPHKGLYAVAFAEGLGSVQKPGKAADGAWKMTPENDGKATDSADASEPTPSSMEC